MKFTTSPQSNSTHVVDDGGCIYYLAAPGKTNDEVAEAFRAGFDGDPGECDVTTLANGIIRSDYGPISQ